MTSQRSRLPFALLTTLPLLMFSGLAIAVYQHGTGFLWDIPILQFVHATSNVEWQSYVMFLTKLGSFRGIFSLSVGIAVAFTIGRQWRSLLYLTITVVGSAIINRVAKALIHRERPHLWDEAFREIDYAFPSGHAMLSMTLVIVVLVLMWKSRWTWFILAIGGVFVGAIAFTRLYLGVHYPSDIVAGWLLAIAWSVGMAALISPHSKMLQKITQQSGDLPN